MLRFRLQPKDDLSSRADFSLGLMRLLGKEVQSAVQESPEAKSIQEKADVDADVTVSLTMVEVAVRIKKKTDAEIPKAEMDRLRKDIGSRIQQAVREKMSSVLQQSIKSARSRM